MLKKACIILLVTIPVAAFASENARVKLSFDLFKKSIADRNGKDAVNLIDRTSIAYCGTIVENSLSMPADKFDQQEMIEKFYIIRLTATTLPFYDLLKMHGKEFVEYSVNNDWFNSRFISSITIEDIVVEGDTAYGDITVNSKRRNFRFRFIRESGEWKFSLISYLELVNSAMKFSQIKRGQTELKFLTDILQQYATQNLENFKYEPVLKNNEKSKQQ